MEIIIALGTTFVGVSVVLMILSAMMDYRNDGFMAVSTSAGMFFALGVALILLVGLISVWGWAIGGTSITTLPEMP